MTFRTRVRFPPPPPVSDRPAPQGAGPSDVRPGTRRSRVRRPARVAPAAIHWIERELGPGARVARARAMPPSSTAKHAIDVDFADGESLRFVLRRYHDARRLENDPWYVPANEALALTLVAAAGVPAPRLHAADLEGAFCESPALLESWIEGEAAWRPQDLAAFLRDAAAVLVRVHAVKPADARLRRYAPYREPGPLVSPPFSTRPGLWESVGEILERPAPAHRDTFIHRDYHPGNVLWDGARVTGVVDWATAALGPPGIDLARMRLNLAWHLGVDAADRFTAAYAAAGGDPSARHPFWDLLDAADVLSDLDPPPARRAGFARFERYVAGVLLEYSVLA